MSRPRNSLQQEREHIAAIQEAGDVLFAFTADYRREDKFREDYKAGKPVSIDALKAVKEAHALYLSKVVNYTIYLEKVFEDHQFRSTDPVYGELIRNTSVIGIEDIFSLFRKNKDHCSDDDSDSVSVCISETLMETIRTGRLYQIFEGIRIQHAASRKITNQVYGWLSEDAVYKTITRFIKIRDLFVRMYMTHSLIDYAIDLAEGKTEKQLELGVSK